MSWTAGSIVVDGLRLAYQRTGSRGLPVLVLLHGMTDDGTCWARVAHTLEDEFDILMPDARGHGHSDSFGDPFTNERLAADVAGILDDLHIRDALVWGHSMGAITAIALLDIRPDLVRGVILEDPPIEQTAPPPAERIAAMRADTAIWATLSPEERHERAASQLAPWPRDETDPWADSKALVSTAILDQTSVSRPYDWVRALRGYGGPGLLVTGDPALHAIVTPPTAARAMAAWPTGRLLHVQGAGHSIHRDRWEESMAGITAFLRQAAP